MCASLFVCVVRVCLSRSLLHVCHVCVCAFRGSSQQWERRRGRSKLFDHLGCCYKALDVSTLCLSHDRSHVSHDRSHVCHMTGHKHVT